MNHWNQYALKLIFCQKVGFIETSKDRNPYTYKLESYQKSRNIINADDGGDSGTPRGVICLDSRLTLFLATIQYLYDETFLMLTFAWSKIVLTTKFPTAN